jgi:lipopolysaccharide export system protein LptC
MVINFVNENTAAYGIQKVEIFILDPQEGKSTYQVIKHHLKYEAQND